MSAAIEVRIPNIGDFQNIAVIDVLVKPGDTVKVDDPLVTLESDKAAMDVPSPANGVVEAVAIKVGDKVSEGSAVLTLSGDAQAATPANGAAVAAARSPAASVAAQPPQPAGERLVELRVPDIGDFKDVPVVDVVVKQGDAVEREAPLVVLESEKAAMEIPSTESGRIASVALKAGDKVSQGTLIATIAVSAAAEAPAASVAPPPAAPSPSPIAAAPAPPAPSTASLAASGGTVHASPSIRRFARELGVSLASVRGTGPSGRITREDVQGFVKAALAAPPPGGSMPFTLSRYPP